MVASTAFHVGLALSAAESAEGWREETDFERVHRDFYAAGREGLAAELAWPASLDGGSVGPLEARIGRLLAQAAHGLARAGVDSVDVDRCLAVIEGRVGSGRTGAAWQREALARAERTRPRDEAIVVMFDHYLGRSREGQPVHEWTLPS